MKVNGKTVELAQKQNLLEFITTNRFDCKTIAVELNGLIIPKAEYKNTMLSDNDTLEIVRFVGGG